MTIRCKIFGHKFVYKKLIRNVNSKYESCKENIIGEELVFTDRCIRCGKYGHLMNTYISPHIKDIFFTN